MKKNFILLFILIFIFHTNHAFILDKLLNLKKSAQEVRNLARELDGYSYQIFVSRERVFNLMSITTTDTYWCESSEAYHCLEEYFESKKNLKSKIFLSHLCDSIILGMGASYFYKKQRAMPIGCSVFACILGIITHQNYNMGKIPYFDLKFEKQRNEFSALGLSNALRAFLMLIQTGLVIYLIENFYKNHFNQRDFQCNGSFSYV